MAGTKDFMHLPFSEKVTGKPRYPRTTVPGEQRTNQNMNNRASHGGQLRSQAVTLSRFWTDRQAKRQQRQLPTIAGGIPFLLEIEPTTDVEFLRGLGFEVVCDLAEGFIVVSTEEKDLNTFLDKVDGFIVNQRGAGNVAKVYALYADEDRLSRILSETLYAQWNTLDDEADYIVEVSVSCSGISSPPNLPNQRVNETEEDYNARIKGKQIEYQRQVDELIMERQTQLENIVRDYEGELITSFIEDGDTFSVTIRVAGKGLRDLVLNYSYIFEVSLKTAVLGEITVENTQNVTDALTLIAPAEDSPIVCVIDSGVQENHKYIEQAILAGDSVCLIPDETDVTDRVRNGGHGTRVAGAVLYPKGVPTSGEYQLPCFVRNAKVLDRNNGLWDSVSREGIIETVVKKFAKSKTKVFNHSIGEGKPFYELKHMSPWAAKIDEVSYNDDILFVQAAGNMGIDIVKAHITAGYSYPDYLGRPLSQISNPAQSLQALTVGSISHSDFENDDTVAMGKIGEPSAFTRVGPGIWDSIKPDVVEFGGTYAISKTTQDINITTPPEVCTELIRRSPEGPHSSKDGVGTSFAAPKVSYIAAEVQKVLPDSPALLYRALIAQSARWMVDAAALDRVQCPTMLRRIGYGLPDVERATHNNEYRATLITMNAMEIGEGEAHIFTVNLPQQLRDLGEDYNILLEITLSYAAKPKRTRRTYRSYLSTWLDWTCSKKNETIQDFQARIFEADTTGQNDGQFPWVIHERQNWGQARDFARPRQTLQKDWCVVNASEFTDEFCIAVRGHKGWGSLFKAKYALAVSFEAVENNIPLYEYIRLANIVEVETEEVRIEVDDFTEAN
ncbi:MAG: S8 family peptidase [Myxococcales bacterium]|jgi:hypothetical protein|nr:S8 family peptidase [Myxococcales bacterium]